MSKFKVGDKVRVDQPALPAIHEAVGEIAYFVSHGFVEVHLEGSGNAHVYETELNLVEPPPKTYTREEMLLAFQAGSTLIALWDSAEHIAEKFEHWMEER